MTLRNPAQPGRRATAAHLAAFISLLALTFAGARWTGEHKLKWAPILASGMEWSTQQGLSISPSSATVPPGGSTRATVRWPGSVSICLSADVPANLPVNVSFDPTCGSNFSATMPIDVGTTTPPGTYTIVVVASVRSDPVDRASFTLTVSAPTPTPAVGTIRGVVFEDTDEDGMLDPNEPRLAGVTVRLRENPQGSDLEIRTTSTSGIYEFLDVDPGTYYVVERDPPGYNSTTPNTVEVIVEAGERIEVNFGDVPASTSTPTPIATETPTPTPPATETPIATSTPPAYFVADQVIITGPGDEIDELIQAISQIVELTRVERLDLSYFARLPRNARIRFPADKRERLAMDLYTIADGTPVARVVTLINEQAMELGLNVFADPNDLTGRPPIPISGDDPWCWEPAPFGGPAEAASDSFHEQWALGQDGIGLFIGAGNQQARSIPYTGQGIRVGIFDTSPFDGPGEQSFEELTLTVSHPLPAATLPPPTEEEDVSDHGLFVAGLIHTLAPASDIHLTRVLNEHGQGDLFTLNKALSTFVTDAINDNPAGAVINLSLGVHPPPDPTSEGLPEDVVALETILFGAEGLGIVIVAASGNDSDPMMMQLPADYAAVIGVAASNLGRGRACFSNRGEVAAPAGDGEPPTCDSMIPTCSTQPEFCLISLARYTAPTTHYAYWTGTSFSTPLVSGLAALILEKAAGQMTPAQVTDAIYQSARPAEASLGAGVIHLRRALLPFGVYLPLVTRESTP